MLMSFTVVYLFLVSYGRTKPDQIQMVIPSFLQVGGYSSLHCNCTHGPLGLCRSQPPHSGPRYPHHVLYPPPHRHRVSHRTPPTCIEGPRPIRTQDCRNLRCEGVHGRPSTDGEGRLRRDAARSDAGRECNGRLQCSCSIGRNKRETRWSRIQSELHRCE